MERKVFALVVFALCAAAMAGGMDRELETKACRDAVSRFGAALLGELSRAMASGGASEAVDVCRVRAPEIAKGLSEETGIRLRRTALKVRNPENAPDDWERGNLEDFQSKKDRGADLSTLEVSQVAVEGNRRVLRYMKAIPTKATCLKCHGAEVEANLLTRIRVAYPKDEAVGFREGDLRGAFSLRKDLGPSPK